MEHKETADHQDLQENLDDQESQDHVVPQEKMDDQVPWDNKEHGVLMVLLVYKDLRVLVDHLEVLENQETLDQKV